MWQLFGSIIGFILYFIVVWSPALVGLIILIAGIRGKNKSLIISGSVLFLLGLTHLILLFGTNWYLNMN